MVFIVDDNFIGNKKRVRELLVGVDVVFDPICGTHLWHSRKALRPGGRVVGYGLRSLIAQRFPLAEARHAHESLGKGGVTRQDRPCAQRVIA